MRLVHKAGDPVPDTTNTRFATTLYETCRCRVFTVTKVFTVGEDHPFFSRTAS